jgi:DNA-binding MarR family transcriptional regulator
MASAMNLHDKPMTMRQYQALADFRYELRRFLRHSEQMTRRNGLTPLQYQLLLQIKSYSDSRSATIGALAERLQSKHHGVVALATRCEKLGLLVRQASKEDRRVVYLTLSVKGDRALERLARWHRDEHRSLKGRLVVDGITEIVDQQIHVVAKAQGHTHSPTSPGRANRILR